MSSASELIKPGRLESSASHGVLYIYASFSDTVGRGANINKKIVVTKTKKLYPGGARYSSVVGYQAHAHTPWIDDQNSPT